MYKGYSRCSKWCSVTVTHAWNGTYASQFQGLSEDSRTPLRCKSTTEEGCVDAMQIRNPSRFPKEKIAQHHIVGLRWPLHGTTSPNPLAKSRIKIFAGDERIIGWCGIAHFNCLNRNTMTLNTVAYNRMSLTNVCLWRIVLLFFLFFFFFWLINHRLNRSLKNWFFFLFLEFSIMFDQSGNDRKINFFLQIFFVNYAKIDVYFCINVF